MPISDTYKALRQIALHDHSDIVLQANILLLPTGDPHKLRIEIVDGSFLDVFISVSGRYSYHWDRRLTPAKDMYRHDNAPHRTWRSVATYPRHFHNGAEDCVVESTLRSDPQEALREFLAFVRHKLLS